MVPQDFYLPRHSHSNLYTSCGFNFFLVFISLFIYTYSENLTQEFYFSKVWEHLGALRVKCVNVICCSLAQDAGIDVWPW